MATTSSTSAAPPYTSFRSSSSSSFTPLSKHVDWLEPAVPADPVPADPTFTRASQVPSHLHDPHHDSKRPIYHPQSAKGWSSDPCGPIFYKGRYHLFYQHLRSSCQWYWGLCWDHLVSDDLVHWKNLPPAIIPTPGWYDADGCFSGTVEFDPELGVPVIMYTGVYLKANKEAVAAHGLPPPGHDPGTRFVERQLAAVPADPEDPDLTVWRKLPEPVMYPAPQGVSCWRDPFCVQRPAAAGGSGDEWVVGLASGIKGVGGAVLRFTSKHFTHGWTFDGYLADGDNQALGLRGNDWECPILSRLPRVDTPPALANLPARKAGGSEAAGKQQLLEQAAAAAAASLGPSVSQQLPPLSKHKRGAGSMSSCASTGSLLGVGHYPAGCAVGCDSETISSSISDCSRVSEVSSGASYGATQQGYAQHAPSSLVASSSSVALDRVVSAAPTMVSATNSSSSTAVTCGSHVEACGTAAGGAADGAVAPLTEPVLAAATEAAAAAAAAAVACDGALTQQHPSTNLYAWLEQAPEPAQAAVAAAAAVVGAGDVAGLALTNSASTRTSTDPVAVLGGSPADMLQLAPAAATTGSITDSSCSSKDWFFCISPEACNFQSRGGWAATMGTALTWRLPTGPTGWTWAPRCTRQRCGRTRRAGSCCSAGCRNIGACPRPRRCARTSSTPAALARPACCSWWATGCTRRHCQRWTCSGHSE
ncbi:glycosyl hydrolase [Scenedesmus sp. NREL 46B-D3]|nr:glycosyl hydrolase [Scenedesmus sp. NREL 46B-D3]